MPQNKVLTRLDSLLTELEQDNQSSLASQIQNNPGWSWECDADGSITFCSPEVKYLLGISADHFIGKQIDHYQLTPDSMATFKYAFRNGYSPKEIQVNYLTNLGDILPVITTLQPLDKSQGKIDSSRWQGDVRVIAQYPYASQDIPDLPAATEPDKSSLAENQSFLASVRSKPQGYLAEHDKTLPAGKFLTDIGEESLHHQQLVYSNTGSDDPASMALPSRLHDNSANLLVELVDLHSPRRWTEDEITLVEQVTDQLTLALENAQLFRQTQTQAEELSLLRQISLELARQQYDLRSVIEIILRRATELLDSDAGAIWLWNEAESQLKLHSAYSARGFCGNLSKLEFRDESHRVAFQNRKTQVLDGYRLWEEAAHLPGDPPVVPAMVAPLIWQTRGIGVLLIARNQPAHPYTPNEQHLFELLAAQAAAVIQNATLFDQTQKALEETDLLYKASAEINASLSYGEILNVLRSYTILGDQSRAVTINLYDRPWSADAPPEWYDIIAQWSLDGDAEQEPVRYALSTIPFADQLLCASSPTIIEDIASDTRWSANQRNVCTEYSQARGLITAPLVSAGQGIGHITAFYPRPINVAETAIRRLTTLAGQAAIAIQNMRLLDETRRRADELQTAAEIARDTSGTLSLEILLSRTAEMIRERFGYYHTAIFLTDEKEDYAYRSISTNPGTKGLRQHPIKIQVGSYSVVGYVTRVGEPYLVNDVTQDPFYQVDPLLPETQAEVGIPLKIGNRVIGALDVQSSRVNAFTPNDISVLQILADQIAVAVENARSYQISLEAVEEMRKADQLKSQFLANMSHELRTPLNSIIGFSRVILKGIDGPISETQEQDLLAIHGSGQHLLSLINDILDLSKIEAGKMELSLVDQVQVADLVHSILSTASGLVKDKPIEIICEITPKLPPVKADPLKIRQVLLNLISNAAKFTDQGSITIKAEKITGESGDAYIQVSVSDTGQGISSEDQKKLFLPFSQVDASPTRKTGGSGLGLSICRHLIEMHHGQIGVHSQVGLGSTFYFTLPISNPSAPE